MSMMETDSAGSDEMIVHPAFDPVTCLWFLETGEEARSIADLKGKLPENVKIVGYYPNGYDGKFKVKPPTTTEPPILRPNYNPLATEPKIIPPSKRSGARLKPVQQMPLRKINGGNRRRKYDHDAILNLWVKGKTGKQIALELGIADWKKVCQIVSNERAYGDARAVSRAPARI